MELELETRSTQAPVERPIRTPPRGRMPQHERTTDMQHQAARAALGCRSGLLRRPPGAHRVPTLNETRGNGWIAYTYGELRTMWFPPPTAGRRWLYRGADEALYWVLPDVDDGVMVRAMRVVEAA